MISWSLRMTITGLLLILAGFLFALAFGRSVDHEARLAAHDAYRPVFEEIAGSDQGKAWPVLEQEISKRSIAHRRAADTHGHSVNMGILLILTGLLAPLLADTGRNNGRFLLLLAASAIIYPSGLFLQFLRFTLLGEVLSAAGAIAAVAALVALLMRLWHAIDRLEAREP